MQHQKSSTIFDQEFASSYDSRFAKLAPMRDALHLLIRALFSELRAEARILCIGVGTGSELINLAQNFPQWHFTAVEPSSPMLNICRRRTEESGIASRCVFHEGYLDSLPSSDLFDAATSLLVSQFCVQTEERCNFFHQIAARLRPNGYLVSADLASDMSSTTYQSLLEIWLRMFKYSELPAKEIENFRVSHGRDIAVLPLHEVESIIASSGFETPVLFLQTLLIHAWYAKRAP